MSDLPDIAAAMPEIDRWARQLQKSLQHIQDDPQRFGHRPNRMQEAFLLSESRRKIVVAANRIGKSECAMRDVLWRARGRHPYRKVKPHSVIWVGAPDYPSYLRFHKPMFDRWCPPSWIKGTFNKSEKWVDIHRVDGGVCRIFFLSYDMDSSKWQGAAVDHIHLDEEPPQDIFAECVARVVTTRGSITLTFTPVLGVGWWYDRIYEQAEKGKGPWTLFQWALATYDEGNEAEFNVGKPLVTHLTRQEIVDFASGYPDLEDRLIRIFGMVKSKKGLVYKGYQALVHRVPAFPIPAGYYLWGALDPGYHGFAAVIAAQGPDGVVYIAAEYFSQQESTRTRFEELADRVRDVRHPSERERPVTVVFFVDTEDPQVVLELNLMAVEAAERDAVARKSPVTLVFASLDQGLKARKAGFLRVQQLLQLDPDRKTPRPVTRERSDTGEPLLYFFDSLHSEWQSDEQVRRESRVLWEIGKYSWKKPTRGTTVARDDADEYSADGAHAMAALRYCIMARLGPPDDDEADRQGSVLSDHAQAVWDDLEELESRMLEGSM